MLGKHPPNSPPLPPLSLFYMIKKMFFIPNMTEESEFQQSRRLDFEPGKAGGEAAPARSRGDAAGFKGQDAGEDENRFFSHIRYTIDDTSKAKSILIEAFNRFGKGEFQKVQ